ncbi:MAG TPA: VWA domain-containing protein [Myxococcota bacterium]|nr:VWA domain-containing protein [Myxococcota bacterium]
MIARVFSHPEWLPAVGAIVGAGSALALAGGLRARARLRTLLGDAAPGPGLRADTIMVAALVAVGLALLGPRAGHRAERVIVSGVDLVVLFDVSRSMDARDAPPSRLERAVRVAADVLAGLGPGDRAALAAFAGRGVLLTPLTPDAGALREMLSGFDGELMQNRGSELGAGIREAVAAFQDGSTRPRVLLLLSDGEAPLGQDAADLGTPEAVRAGVRVVAVGLGTEAGATVPDHGVPLLDGSGRVVISRRDLGRLAALAAATGGELEPTDDFGAVDPAHLLATLRRDAPSAPGVSVERRVPRLWVWPVTAFAFALLLGEAAPGLPRLRLRPQRPSLRIAALSGFWVLWLVPTAETAGPDFSNAAPRPDAVAELPVESMQLDELEALTQAHPADPLALLRLGLARSRGGLHEDAARAYLAAGLHAHDPAMAALAWYDLGVAELAQGDLAAARDAFFDALALEPHDSRTQFNLEWTLRALAEPPPPPGDTREPPKRSGDDGSQHGKAKEGGAAGKGDEKPQRVTSPQNAPPLQEHKAHRPGSEPGSDAPPGGPPPSDAGASENARAARRAPVLSPEQAWLWLASVTEEPGHALHQAARRATRTASPSPGPAAGGPTW